MDEPYAPVGVRIVGERVAQVDIRTVVAAGGERGDARAAGRGLPVGERAVLTFTEDGVERCILVQKRLAGYTQRRVSEQRGAGSRPAILGRSYPRELLGRPDPSLTELRTERIRRHRITRVRVGRAPGVAVATEATGSVRCGIGRSWLDGRPPAVAATTTTAGAADLNVAAGGLCSRCRCSPGRRESPSSWRRRESRPPR